jgi:hypothetical protein
MALATVAQGVWIDSDPVNILGMEMTATMAVLKLDDGGLLLYSPVSMTAERRAALEALGAVAHLYAPNLFHHRWLGEWAAAYPSAKVHAPRGLAKKRPDLRVDRLHGTELPPSCANSIDEHCIEGFRLRESVLLHRPSRTLLVADLVHNVGRPEGAWARFYTRAMGFYDRVALSRMIRWTAFADRAAARRSLETVLAAPFERVVVGHGAPIQQGGKQALVAAFSWLLAQ